MLELGRKKTLGNKCRGEHELEEPQWVTYKAWFEAQGIDHTSIDIKGGYGSLPLDLTQPLDMEPFDMVTNIGTTEHVDHQEPCWRNIHNLLNVGGVLVSMTPLEGDWWWHGQWYPRVEFFEQFAKNGYTIDRMEIGLEPPHRNIEVRMTKNEHCDFIMPDEETIFYNKTRPRHG